MEPCNTNPCPCGFGNKTKVDNCRLPYQLMNNCIAHTPELKKSHLRKEFEIYEFTGRLSYEGVTLIGYIIDNIECLAKRMAELESGNE